MFNNKHQFHFYILFVLLMLRNNGHTIQTAQDHTLNTAYLSGNSVAT